MQATRFSELRPRGVWDIVDDAFDLYRERFVLLLSAVAVIYVPMAIANLLIMSGPTAQFLRNSGTTTSPEALLGATGIFFASIALTAPLRMIADAIYGGVVAFLVADSLGARRIQTLGQAYGAIKGRIWPLIGASSLALLAAAGGILACYVGIIYVFVVILFVGQSIVIENKGIITAFRRSRSLILPEFGKGIGLILLIGSLGGILSGGIEGILSGLALVVPQGSDPVAAQVQQQLINQVLSSLVGLVLAPLSGIACTLLYYDLRVRREGFDIIARAEESGVTLAPDPYGDLTSDEARKRAKQLQGSRR